MPTFFIEAPTGVRIDAKRQMMRDITTAIDEAYQFADTRIFLREWDRDNVAIDGEINVVPFRPVCFLEAPELKNLDTRRNMVERILAALAVAYQDIADTDQALILMNHYPLEDAAWAGRLGSDHPDAVAAIKQMNGSGG